MPITNSKIIKLLYATRGNSLESLLKIKIKVKIPVETNDLFLSLKIRASANIK